MTYRVQGATNEWEVVMGLEIHAQVTSQAKLFSGASAKFGAEPNEQVSLVDAAMPGMLPVINAYCIEQAVRTGLGLGATINLHSVFERKNYFYPDLPFGYQISQFLHPIVGEGVVVVDLPDGTSTEVGIERLHLEQDAGKSLHDQDPRRTYIDLNRAGVALMEIVSKPDLRSPDEVGAYLRKIRSILRYLGTCDGNMEEGSMRCDVNVSVRPVGEQELRTRCEMKNINSVRFAMQAIEFEAQRQVDIYDAGGAVDQETRLFDSDTGETRPMRSKEEAHDYRYFPDPDLLPVDLTQEFVERIGAQLPELPDAKKRRFSEEYELKADDAAMLVAERETAEYFESVASGRDPKMAANWVIQELLGALNRADREIGNSPVSADQLGKLIDLISADTISNSIARDVFETMFETSKDPQAIVAEKGLEQISDTGEIETAVDKVIADNPDDAAEFRGGNQKVLGWFVGQVLKATQGKANPKLVNELLRDKLK